MTKARGPQLKLWIRRLLPGLVLVAGILLAMFLMRTAPKAPRVEQARTARPVRLMTAEAKDHQVVVEATGEVVAARRVSLQAEVGGKVVAVHTNFIGGGLFKQGEWMVRLDRADYELVLRQRSADLAKVQSSLEREEGEAATAAEEFALLPGGSEIPEAQRRLALRQPQLESARAAVSSAEAAVDKAKLDLERTEISAPFDCIVLNKQIELGAHAQPGAPVAEVAGIEAFHVRVRLPPRDLRWVPLPQFRDRTNAVVRVYDDTAWGHFAFREGRVIRGIPERDDRSRMLGLLVEVPEPLPIDRDPRAYPPLVLNSFVRVAILGRTLRNAVALPRRSVRDGSVVWVMAEDDRLEIRPVEIAYRGRDDFILRSGVAAGERIVVSDLTAPVAGMALRAVEN
jgi:RND family efflux transporter MFP subunit